MDKPEFPVQDKSVARKTLSFRLKTLDGYMFCLRVGHDNRFRLYISETDQPTDHRYAKPVSESQTTRYNLVA